MSESLHGKSVLLAGATGLVGRECLDLLLADPAFASVRAIVRRVLRPRNGQERLTIKKIDFDYLEDHPALFASDQILCALGTTMRQAGTKTAFRRVDYEYPLRIAQLGLAHGARHFLLVSAVGANPHSRIFYNRVKGEIEEAIFRLGYRSLTIVRPSLLLGKRGENRFGEEFTKRFSFLFPKRLRPVHARQVASALVRAAKVDAPGFRVIDNLEIQAFPAICIDPPGIGLEPGSA